MKEKITDLMEFMPEEYLDGIEIDSNTIGERNNTIERKSFWRSKTVIVLASCLALLLGGCVGYTIMKPNLLKYIVQDKKLEEELVVNNYKQVENDNYRISVETVIADINCQYIVFSLEALSDEAKRNFDKQEPNVFITRSKGGGGALSEYPLLDEKYKKYYQYKSTTVSEEGNMKCQVGMLKDGYEDDTVVYEIFYRLLENDGYSDINSLDPKVQDAYIKKAYKEAADITMSFDIEVEDKNITVSPSENVFPKGNNVEKITVRRLSITIVGTDIGNMSSDISLPSIVYRYKDGTEDGIVKGNMGYDNRFEGNLAGGSTSTRVEDGSYTYIGSYPYALDIDEIEAVIINGIEYEM